MSLSNHYRGLLCIGDPHLATRPPGFRKDGYAQAVLDKLRFCVAHAREHRLLLVILGDLFHHPRDIANWMLVDLISLFADEPAYTVAGNHDCHENSLSRDDTLSVLAAAGAVKLLDQSPWRGAMNGCDVIVGGTSWGKSLPKKFERDGAGRVFWITHHDLRFPGYEDAGRFGCYEIDGVDVVINGHIHRRLDDVTVGQTTWMNPGNICRVSRSEITRTHKPAVLRFDVSETGHTCERIEIPHQAFDDVFYPAVEEETTPSGESGFIQQLAALTAHRTAGGAGLESFLEANLGQFDPRVAREIRLLTREVLHGHTN
jgi:predicted phosphodiesterase